MLKVMKKYSIPQTEAITMIMGSAICDESAGRGQFGNETPGGKGGPGAAPSRVSVLYI